MATKRLILRAANGERVIDLHDWLDADAQAAQVQFQLDESGDGQTTVGVQMMDENEEWRDL